MESQFNAWLEEEVYTSQGIDHVPRKYLIWEFTGDLQEFLQSEGYQFRSNEKEIAQDWARFLFWAQKGLTNRQCYSKNPDASPEDCDMYYYLFDNERWDGFLSKWKDVDDFTKDRNCEVALHTVPVFIWFHVNIMTSDPTQKVDDMMGISDNDEDGSSQKRKFRGRRPYDPYLEDQANAINKQNRWD